MLADYYNRHPSQHNYDQVLFRAGKGLQSAELNEIQSQAYQQTRGIADALLKEGDLIEDGQVVVQLGEALVEAGKVYLRGLVRDVAQAAITIPMDQLVDIGVWLSTTTVTELEDAELRDPANDTRNYGEPGAARQQYQCVWGLADADFSGNNSGDFFPVHKIDQGVLLVKHPPPQLDSVTVALARYDRESNGSYDVNGFRALFLNQDEMQQHFTISEGKAHVDGLEISLKSAIRKSFALDPDLQQVISEPHQFSADEQGKMTVNLSHSPLADISRVNAALEKTVNLQRGISITDPLPDSSVYQLIEVKQASKSYVEGSDFDLANDTINWSRSGDEPASGSSYEATYRYRVDVEPTEVGENGFSLTNLVANEVFFVDYRWKLPRIDLLTIDPDGIIRRITGIAHPWQPTTPALPEGQLALATIEQTWSEITPLRVLNQAIRVVPMVELEAMQQQISDLYDLVAIERLRNDINLDDPVAKKGVFVDPFIDDDLRDQGVAQTAAIIDGELMLPITGEAEQVGIAITTAQTLPYELEPILVQAMKTGSMKVNPYQAFEPIPAQITLTPALDRWTQVNDSWTGATTTRFIWRRGGGTSSSTSFVETGRTSTQAEFLRPRPTLTTVNPPAPP
ncbi:MAG: DUF4815 domain-containing protein, partial [Psychrosphaera sp.]|nr:DUF4815 domain-containing protein [Psychrosphaera sp.]